MKNFSTFFIILLVSFSNISKAQNTTTSSSNLEKIVDKHIKSLLKNKEIHSVSVGIYKDDISNAFHYGELEKGKNNSPNNATIFEIASITKTMTGYLVATAEKEGKINLEDDVRMYLNEEYLNLEFEGNPIRIKHLITHTSGLGHFMSKDMVKAFENFESNVPVKFYEAETNYSKKTFFKDLHQFVLTSSPGSAYSYSNAGAELMGYILEKVYNKSVDQLLKEMLFQKAHMQNSAIAFNTSQENKPIKGYWMGNNEFSPNFVNPLWGSGAAVKSTVTDMINYIKFQLDTENSNVSKSHQVLHQEGKTLKVGYFWRVWQDKYGTSYNHHGGTAGMQSWIFIFPKYNLGIFIATNQSGPKTAGRLSKTVKKIVKDIVE